MSDQIKEAFSRVKEDILSLKTELNNITSEIQQLKRTLRQTDSQTDTQTHTEITQTHPQNMQTDRQTPSHKHPLEASKPQNSDVSIGNQGVQTDRQTNRQTDRHSQKFALVSEQMDNLTKIEKVSEVLSSLDDIKRDLRTQFKKLTSQEMLVFSTIYQLEEEGQVVDYSLLASKTSLSESSIRDYVQKIIKKEIPVIKRKENNKRVILTIPSDFKRMATLPTIISLRDL